MNIFESINKVMADIGAVGKNSKNLQQGFMFRGIDAVMNAINPALIKNKVFVVPEILEQIREERVNAKGKTLIYSICKVKYTFYAEDGSSIESIVIGEGMDTGDKATNKAMSIAFKYACFQVFCIPTEEMKDPDEEVHEVKPRSTSKPLKITQESNQQTQQSAPQQSAPQQVAADKMAVISKARLEEICKVFHDRGINREAVCKLYSVKELSYLNNMKYDNIMSHLDDIEKRCK